MAVVTIKDYQDDNQNKVDSTGHVYVTDGGQPIAVTGSVTATNPSVGLTGTTAPTSATEVGGVDPNGNLTALSVNSSGALIVSEGTALPQVVVNSYMQITGVVYGVATTIVTYTAPGTGSAYLLLCSGSGSNIGEFTLSLQGTPIDNVYTTWTEYNFEMDYRTEVSTTPGLLIPAGNVLSLVVTQGSNNSTGNFNGRIQVMQIG